MKARDIFLAIETSRWIDGGLIITDDILRNYWLNQGYLPRSSLISICDTNSFHIPADLTRFSDVFYIFR